MAPPGGIEPLAIHPALRVRLEDGCQDRGASFSTYLPMSTCSRCGVVQTPANSYSRGRNRKGLQGMCKKCFSAYCCDRWIQKKKDAIQYLGGACSHCKGKFPYPCYDFHHLRDKDVGWDKLRLRSPEAIKKELDKCTLLCANCHRIEHSKVKSA